MAQQHRAAGFFCASIPFACVMGSISSKYSTGPFRSPRVELLWPALGSDDTYLRESCPLLESHRIRIATTLACVPHARI